MSTETVVVDQLRAAQRASPSLLRQCMADPALYRRVCEEARRRARPAPWLRPLGHHLCLEPDGEVRWVPGQVGEDAEPVQPMKRTRQRKPTVASVIRQMQRAGVEIAGIEINPRDGTIIVRTGNPLGGIDMDDTASADPRWN